MEVMPGYLRFEPTRILSTIVLGFEGQQQCSSFVYHLSSKEDKVPACQAEKYRDTQRRLLNHSTLNDDYEKVP
ncbi:hypothetical protein BDP81DRAFT_171707 [Colletotrichum phormii]|uniref:Uncharacterized protein n=1 Tax=Colletotrichum phormii TaxID=359342 RepID=A0AAJ0E7L3_9PEZI|nr:uncharacterized protein BDP81DRAFT_171707 [Colletotrichum phormii]KAK1621854.1 hypothetical protein BDP81DRAFT_171707 [Colletotrichum phormii]